MYLPSGRLPLASTTEGSARAAIIEAPTASCSISPPVPHKREREPTADIPSVGKGDFRCLTPFRVRHCVLHAPASVRSTARACSRLRSYQPLSRCSGPCACTRTRASTATQPSGPARIGLRSSSATSGRSAASRPRRSTRSASARASAAGAPRKPRDELARLASAHELVRVDVGERREPEGRLADQLGERPARPERDERPERRDPGRCRRAARCRRAGTAGRSPARRSARPHRALAPRRGGRARRRRCSVLWTPATAVFTTAGNPSSRAAATASSTSRPTRSGTSGMP